MKNDNNWNIFSNLSSGQQYFLNDIEKLLKISSSKFDICLEKKNQLKHKFSVFFCKNWNKKDRIWSFFVILSVM